MKLTTEHNEKVYTYEESVWTGKKVLLINGVKCLKTDKKTFADPETKEVIVLKGNYLGSVKLEKKSGTVFLKKNGGFEWTFVILSFLVTIMSFALLSGAIGGGIGGALGVVAAYLNTSILFSKQSKGVKGLLCSLVIIGSCVLWWIIYTFIIVLMLL